MVSPVYGATFPKIVVDETINYPNSATLKKNVSVEEWNDLFHHTHCISDIVDENGVALGGSGSIPASGGGVSVEEYQALQNKVTTLESTIATLQQTISTLLSDVEALKSSSGSSDSDGIDVGDWDVTRPGIQGPND